MKRKSPCTDCTSRSIGCHANCEPYISWKAARAEAQRHFMNERTTRDYTISEIFKNKKK